MPKSMFVDPQSVRAPGAIHFEDIPVNQYQGNVASEKKTYTREQFLRMYHDMAVIREFETMLSLVKIKGQYANRDFTYPGPAHLSTGQEAAAVGQSFLLSMDDHIFGSHRGHGEVLAKGLSAIELLSDEQLNEIMKSFQGGTLLALVEEKGLDIRETARRFLLLGAMAEIFARDCGFTRGMGGSMHMFFLPFGVFPNNAIVGGSAPIATGMALKKKVMQEKGIVVANAGDGSMGCGPVYESLNFSAMDQYSKLWGEGYEGGLPILFFFSNNSYGMGGQTRGETMAYDMLARMGAGVTTSQMHSERVDGYNILAVIDAMRRKKELILDKKGPVLLDVVTYRYAGHSTSDASSYRSKEEMDAWMAVDPMITFRAELIAAGIATIEELDGILANVKERNESLFLLASDEQKCPLPDFNKEPDFLEKLMFSGEKKVSMTDTPATDLMLTKEENPRVLQIQKRERFAFDANGKPFPKSKQFTLRDGLFEAILDKYYEDPTLVSYGEDVRDWGGAFAVYKGLTECVPYPRLFNSPISEAAIVGTAVGYGMAGGRAIAELMYCDFMGRAGDEIFNQLAKWQSMSGGNLKMPVVLRVSVGAKYAAQHSQDWSALVAHMPGLKVVFPATPYDAKGLMVTALNGTDPVVFLESQRIYDIGEQFHEGGVPKESYELPIGVPDIKRAGTDVTILSIGATLYRVMEAADMLQKQYGISAEVIDARSIVPFDYSLVLESIKKTGRIVLASDACARGSFLSDMARNITEMAFDLLDAPPVVVGARNWITPPFEFDEWFFPQPHWIIDAIHQRILPLEGHVSRESFTTPEQLRRAREGV